jgi:hypothetical protein
MNNKDIVRKSFPNACAECYINNIWSIWDITRDTQKSVNTEYWPEIRRRILLGLGGTESEAWCNASTNRIVLDR